MPYYEELDHLPAEELLTWCIRTFGKRFAISTSFQKSGMVILDMAARVSSRVRVVTLDTGRLPEETYEMMDTVRSRYGVEIETVLPDPYEVQAMVRKHGANLFLHDPSLRMLCCQIRKVRPLDRKLKQLRAYAVGLRRLTSDSRNEIRKVEEKDGTVKASPIADWTRQDIDEYTRRNDVPVHPLYGKGYTSIGCSRCTRPTEEGEDERAGRWWWELASAKECGLHFTANGNVGRKVDVLLEEVSETANGYGFDGSGI
jgi:phosphoadenylyl-sulfate reductase (thioredoxin)